MCALVDQAQAPVAEKGIKESRNNLRSWNINIEVRLWDMTYWRDIERSDADNNICFQ